jgi:hypothetical protein
MAETAKDIARRYELDDTPKHCKRRGKQRKRFGIEYFSRWGKKWGPWQWYLTAKQRDQALAALIKSTPTWMRSEIGGPSYRKTERK